MSEYQTTALNGDVYHRVTDAFLNADDGVGAA
jgi:hypothetical protein